MTWVKILAGLAKKGGQYIVQHPGIVAQVADAGKKIIDGAAEAKQRKLQAQNEAEYYAQLAEENNYLRDKVTEIESKLLAVSEYYDSELESLGKKNEELLASYNKLKQYFVLASILAGVGIIAAILLAILL